ncbi:MAG: Holliday junction resolvase RuvX [Caldisericaceae bacterium]
MGLDVGDERIGVAVSDPLGLFGKPVAILSRGNNVISEIIKICLSYNSRVVVVGLPRNLKGETGPQAQKVLTFVDELKGAMEGYEIVLWDERYTSVIAHRIFQNLDIKGRKERKIKDSMEAVIILEGYLGYLRRTKRKDD